MRRNTPMMVVAVLLFAGTTYVSAQNLNFNSNVKGRVYAPRPMKMGSNTTASGRVEIPGPLNGQTTQYHGRMGMRNGQPTLQAGGNIYDHRLQQRVGQRRVGMSPQQYQEQTLARLGPYYRKEGITVNRNGYKQHWQKNLGPIKHSHQLNVNRRGNLNFNGNVSAAGAKSSQSVQANRNGVSGQFTIGNNKFSGRIGSNGVNFRGPRVTGGDIKRFAKNPFGR